jgi:hypothetical protein
MALTPRQWWLYGYIKAYNERFPDKWLTQRDIVTANNVDVLYPHDDRYHISDNPNAHDKCIPIWLDVAAINRSMEVDKIILINDQTYKMPTSKKEAEKYLDGRKKAALRILKRYWIAKEKIDRDGQGKLLSDQEREITKQSRAKEFYESFIKEIDSADDEEGGDEGQ